MHKTAAAFAKLRVDIGEPRLPPEEKIMNDGERLQLAVSDGLQLWTDGFAVDVDVNPGTPPTLTSEMRKCTRLWAVRQNDVAYAHENCDFGRTLETGVIKHTNLTGAAAAYSGGELLMLEAPDTIVVNGCSGRYGPRSEFEMNAVARAFKASGFNVWSMGFDTDLGKALPFIGTSPVWVA